MLETISGIVGSSLQRRSRSPRAHARSSSVPSSSNSRGPGALRGAPASISRAAWPLQWLWPVSVASDHSGNETSGCGVSLSEAWAAANVGIALDGRREVLFGEIEFRELETPAVGEAVKVFDVGGGIGRGIETRARGSAAVGSTPMASTTRERFRFGSR